MRPTLTYRLVRGVYRLGADSFRTKKLWRCKLRYVKTRFGTTILMDLNGGCSIVLKKTKKESYTLLAITKNIHRPMSAVRYQVIRQRAHQCPDQRSHVDLPRSIERIGHWANP